MPKHILSQIAILTLAVGFRPAMTMGQTPSPSPAINNSSAAEQTPDPLKRDLSKKQKKELARELKKELSRYDDWNSEVRYIITPEERAAFLKLSNNEERDQFIETFWQKRNPDPGNEQNEFKDEYYRRIAYANQHFSAGKPGWLTDRGHVYIVFGKPDEVESHPSGGTYNRLPEEGGGTTSVYPFERWRYRHLEGVGEDVVIEFVDDCMCGAYEFTLDRGKKDRSNTVPGMAPTTGEMLGMSNQGDRFSHGIDTIGSGPFTQASQAREFDRLEQAAKLFAPRALPQANREHVSHTLNIDPLPLNVRTDVVRADDDKVLVPVTIQIDNRELSFVMKDGIARATAHVVGRVTTLTNTVVQYFEKTVQVESTEESLAQERLRASLDWQALPLHPGLYLLDIYVEDVNSHRVGQWGRRLEVPRFKEGELALSSLILADKMERVPAASVGVGSFVLGDTIVRPRVSESEPVSFRRDQKLNMWMQVYNLTVDSGTQKNSAQIEYSIAELNTGRSVFRVTQSGREAGSDHAGQLTIEKRVSLESLQAGSYRVTIKVNDNVSGNTIARDVIFRVE